MSFDSYDDLKTEIAEWLDRDDLTARIPGFITLAEAKIQRKLRIRGMIKRGQASASTSARYLALPEKYLQMQICRLITDPVTRLKYTSLDDMTSKISSASGKPGWYTVHEEIEFDKVPDSAYSVEMIYYAKVTTLSSTNQSNGILTECPDLYLYGALLEAETFLDNDERLPTWRAAFDTGLADANMSHMKSMRGSAPQERVLGATP